MANYFSTFISDLGEFVAEQIRKDLDSVEINLLLDGLVVYESNLPMDRVKQLRYLNNSFQLIKQYDSLGGEWPIEVMVDNFLNKQQNIPIGAGKSFRVMFYYANSPIAIGKRLHEEVEDKILEPTKGGRKKFVVDRTNPDFEYWFLYRQEGYGFFGLRITKHPDYKDILAKGQLRPELATIMVLLSNPQKEDVVLDPFAGSGAIPLERDRYPYQKIIAGDIDPAFIWHSRSDTDTSMYRSICAQKGQNCVQSKIMDALDMQEIADNSIDKIITDPPWGMFQKSLDIQTFYTQFLREADRVLKPGGIMVLLVGRNVLFEVISKQFNNILSIQRKYDILVSGKKASIFVLSNQ